MSTAIILSGHMRNFDVCLPTLHWHVFRHYPDADFYVSTVKDGDVHKVELLREKYGDRVKAVDIADGQPDCVDLLADRLGCENESVVRFADHAPYAISVPVQAVLAQLWQLARMWAQIDFSEYNNVIRCRPDLFFHSFRPCLAASQALALTPWWGRFGGINDRFAVLGQVAAQAYFGTWMNLPELLSDGCPLHPESLIKAQLERQGCSISPTLRGEFSKVNRAGNLERPWLHEVLPNDAANLH